MNVKTYLQQHQIPFQILVHAPTGDASRLAQEVHCSGKHVAKTVLLHVNHSYGDAVAVVPASAKVDFTKVAAMLGGAEVRLATEQDVATRCPDCEMGVLPPFGSQYGMRTLVDESLAGDQIVFEGNTHAEAISMNFADFRRIESPLIGHIATTM